MARKPNMARLAHIVELHMRFKSNKEVARRMGMSKSAVIRARQRWVQLSTKR